MIRKAYHKYKYAPVGEIWMLHRIIERRSFVKANSNLEITPAFFETLILQYIEQGYEFISLNKFTSKLKNNFFGTTKYVVITFDDGYCDNYEQAYPILKKYNIPFTIYVSTSFPNGSAFLWWYQLEEHLMLVDNIQYNNNNFNCTTLDDKESTFENIRKTLHKTNNYTELIELLELDEAKIRSYCISKSLNWEQLTKMVQDKLCTIASHTVNHYALTKLTKQQLVKEIDTAKLELEEKLNIKVEHFAYPYGAWNKDIVGYLRKKEYKTATTVTEGNVKRVHKNQLLHLPRIHVIQ